MDAASLFASNRGCDDYPEHYEDYTWIERDGNESNTALPSFSLGKLTLDLAVRTGNEDLIHPHKFNVYPNPTNSEVLIQLGEDPPSGAIFEIYDITGGVIDIFSAEDFTNIPVHDYPPGIYILQLTYKQKKISPSHKLVVY